MYDTHSNFTFAKVTVVPSPATSGTTIGVSNTDAALFPDPAGGGNTAYNVTVWPANQQPLSTNSEVLRFTAKGAADSAGTGNTQFTISRLQEQNAGGTMTARSIQVGDWIALNITKKWFTDIETNKVEKSGDTMTSLTVSSSLTIASLSGVLKASAGVVSGSATTTDLPEGSNLYYTDTRVRANRLDQMAAPTASVSMNSQKITTLLDPTAAQDAATKSYVDAVKTGLDVKDSVRVATTTALPTNTRSGNILTASANGALTSIDGVSLSLNDRLLVKDEATGANNGIYFVSALGDGSNPWTLTRTTDADSSSEVTAGLYIFVTEGTANADSGWTLTTNDPITLNTTSLVFVQFSGAGQITAGAGLTKTGNTLDVVGTINRITVNADSIDISSSYVGQSSITTIGTITTGVWTGTTIAVANGGTGATSASGARSNLGAINIAGDTMTGNLIVNANIGISQSSPAAQFDITKTAIGSTPSDTNGLVLVNTTAAAAGAQQYSPQVRWRGQGWKTNATAASQSVDFRSYVVPVQGAANPTGYLLIESSVNGGMYSGQVVVTSAGNVGIGITTPSQLLNIVGGAGVDGGILVEMGSIANLRLKRTDATAQSWILRTDTDRHFKIINETLSAQTALSISGTDVTLAGDLIVNGTIGAAALQVDSVSYFFDNTGFGTTTPQTAVHIKDGSLRVENSTDSKSWDLAYDSGGDYLYFDEFGVNRQLYIKNGGLIGIRTVPSARLHVQEDTLGNEIFRLQSVATNDDPNYRIFQQRVATTDATQTTLQTIAITSSNSYFIESRVVARRTGGSSGTADDGAVYIRRALVTTKSGTVTISAVQDGLTQEDQAGWDCTFTVSGSNILLRITGANSNNITWHTTTIIQNLST